MRNVGGIEVKGLKRFEAVWWFGIYEFEGEGLFSASYM